MDTRNRNKCCVVGGAESDMELDLLGESESDSDESTHSHADNASIQRSAVTAATAGSDAGLLKHLHCTDLVTQFTALILLFWYSSCQPLSYSFKTSVTHLLCGYRLITLTIHSVSGKLNYQTHPWILRHLRH